MVARRIQWERRREGPKAAFGKAPEENVSLQVKGGAFAVGVRPSFRKPGNVETSVAVVRDGVEGVSIGETDGGFSGGMGSDSKLCAAW